MLWLGALVPALAFPATYWLLRPWHNVALELALAAYAAVAVALFATSGRRGLGHLALGLATAAALVRPDHVLLLLGLTVTWLVALDAGGAADRRATAAVRRWMLPVLVAGLAWVVGNVVGNLLTTGAPLVTPVDLLDFPDAVSLAGRDLPTPLRQAVVVVAPQGVPGLELVARQLAKYWLGLGPIAFVVVPGLVAAVVALASAGTGPRRRLALGGSLVLLGWHVVSRVSDTDLGAAADVAGLVHSHPRYTAIGHVVLALVLVTVVSRLPSTTWRRLAGVGLVVVAAAGAWHVWSAPLHHEGLSALHRHLDRVDAWVAAVEAEVPDGAFVASRFADRYLWADHPVGRFQDERVLRGTLPVAPERLAFTLDAAVDAGLDPHVAELTDAYRLAAADALAERGLALTVVTADLPRVPGIADAPVYRVERGGDGRVRTDAAEARP